MQIEQAIKKAIALEGQIRDLYADAQDKCNDEAGKRIFGMLRKDEQYHMDYLKKQLNNLRTKGRLESKAVQRIFPGPEQIRNLMDRLEKTVAMDDHGMIQQLLSKALALEVQTAEFYKNMVDTLGDDARDMFARFLEIENAHIQTVQYELDYVQKTGYWFDFKEFDME